MNSSPPPPSRLLQLPLRNKSPKRSRNAKKLSLNVPSLAQLQVAALSAATPKTATAATFDSSCSTPSTGIFTAFPSLARSSGRTIGASVPTSLDFSTQNISSRKSSSHRLFSGSDSMTTQPSSSTTRKQTQNLSIVIPFSSSSPSPTSSPSSTSSSSTCSYTFSNYDSSNPTNRVVVVNTLPLNDPNDFVEPSYASYPSGPILICHPNVYLYSEPTKEIASQFDLVINVAKEVKNPFQPSIPDYISQSSIPTVSSHDCDNLSTHSSISSVSSSSSYSSTISSISPTSSPDMSIFPESKNDSFSKDTAISPKSTVPSYPYPISLSSHKPSQFFPGSNLSKDDSYVPNYVYVPWDHNSAITQDLEYLTDLIHDQSKKGKKILIHCQCGVSRSASLLVAYVMKTHNWGVHQAYQWVKEKSPGISPNMSLIYQLVEWSKILHQDQDSAASYSSIFNDNSSTYPSLNSNGTYHSPAFNPSLDDTIHLSSSSSFCNVSPDLAGLNRFRR